MNGMHAAFRISGMLRPSWGWGHCRGGAAFGAVAINLSPDTQLGKCHENAREHGLAGHTPPGWKDPSIYCLRSMPLTSQHTPGPITG